MILAEIIQIIEPFTRSLRVPVAALTLAICIYSLISIIRYRVTADEEEKINYWPFLCCIFLVAVLLRIVIYPHHAGLMNDDYYNMKNAIEILNPDYVPVNHMQKPIGWPFIISIVYWFTGANDQVLFYTNSVIGCLSVIAIFFLVRLMTTNILAGLAASMYLAVNPLHTMWSICGENNVTAIFFMIVCMAALFGFIRFHERNYIMLALYSASFAAQTRAENLLLFLIMPVGMFLLGRYLVFDIKRIVKYTILPLILAMPSILSYETIIKFFTIDWSANDTGGVVTGQNMSISNLMMNITDEVGRITSSGNFTLIIIIFALLGLMFAWKKEKELVGFLVFAGLSYVLLMNSLWETLACRERFFIYSEVCLIAIGAIGVRDLITRFRNYRVLIIAAFIIVPVVFSAKSHIENLDPANDYFYLGKGMTAGIARMRNELPEGSILIVSDPSPYEVATDFKCITPDMAINEISTITQMNNVYYVNDISSNNTPDSFYSYFNLESVFEFNVRPPSKEKSEYGIYKVINTGG